MSNKDIPQLNYRALLKENGMAVSSDEIKQQFTELVHDEGLITNTSTMSPFWRLIHTLIILPVSWLTDALIEVTLKNMHLATASGKWLDLFAWGVNITRKPAIEAQGVVRFYRTASSANITVPAGTIIQTERINDVVYRLKTIETIVIEDDSALIPVIAEQANSAYNLAPGYYRILPIAINGIERVQNEENWLLISGNDVESDNDLRDRCRNQYNLVANYHTDAVYRGLIASVIGLSIDRIFFLHDGPRGPGTANAYLLLDSGEASQPFVDKVNHYINTEGHHGHGDDMQCFSMPETQHALTMTLFVESVENLTAEELQKLTQEAGNLVRCAFRQNNLFDVKRTWPNSRFSFSNLGKELHKQFALIKSIEFSLDDIISELTIPRLKSLSIEVKNERI